MDYILNGRGHGSVAAQLVESNMDWRILRPFKGPDGKSYINKPRMVGNKEVLVAERTNNVATLLRDDWLRLDETVMQVAKPLLRAVGDLEAAGLTYDIDGMATPVLGYETASDITGATVSMDGMRRGEKDREVYDIAYLPIPIIHKDFSFSARQLAVAKNGTRPQPLDTSAAAKAARRCAEEAESMLIGNSATYSYGGGTIYGYRTFPSRVTKSMTLPTAGGWTPQVTLDEVLDMKQSLIDKMQPSPYVLYTSSNWGAKYLDNDYSAAYSGGSLRQRLQGIEGISAIRTLDYLTGYQMLLIAMNSSVVRLVRGLAIRTLQWPSGDGMEINFKVMMIVVPQIRIDQDANVGIVHGTAA